MEESKPKLFTGLQKEDYYRAVKAIQVELKNALMSVELLEMQLRIAEEKASLAESRELAVKVG